MKKTLYLECYSGISGDMTVAALLDLGADRQVLSDALSSLNLPGYQIQISRVKKSGIDACDFNVILEDCGQHHKHHEHEHPGHKHKHHEHGYRHHELEPEHEHKHHEHEHHELELGHEHKHHEHEHNELEPEHEHKHHEHEHNELELGHEHKHHEHLDHTHRNIHDILKIINESSLTDTAKAISHKIFSIIARAEAKAHGIPEDQVHFHEVGAIDSIVDVAATAVCLDNLKVEHVIISQLYEGQGFVSCQHGFMPVPVPAVVNIITDNHLPIRITSRRGEMVTPTGAAIAAAIRTEESLPESFIIEKVGLGAGKKDFPGNDFSNHTSANILRAFLIEV